MNAVHYGQRARFVTFRSATVRIAGVLAAAVLTAALGPLAFAPSPAAACFMRSSQPVQVWLDHVEVTIQDQAAFKTYDCTFRNPNPVEAVDNTCFMELEPGAQVDNMKVLVDGRELPAEILDVEQAKKVFNDIVQRGGSPALLEYYGNQLIQTRVPKIAANGTVRVQLSYSMVLPKHNGLVRLQMLNTNPKASLQPLKSASAKVKIRSQTPIKNVYSPTHPIKIEESPDADVLITWSQDDYLPRHPLVLFYQTAEDDVAATLLTHREPGEDGHFLLMLSPTIGKGVGAVGPEDALPKDVVFCIDASGSMIQDKRMEQAQAALKYCLANLRDGDRFNIVDFGTGVRTFHEGELVASDEVARQRALRYADKLAARGGTAMDEALETSLALLKESSRPKMVVFLTDGFPTIGERDPDAILRNVSERNRRGVRLFAFGAGYDINTRLLDFLALGNRGESEYVLPEDDLQQKIAGFYDRVGSPLLTDVKLDFGDARVDELQPQQIADIYRGEQVLIFGRYQGAGKHRLKLAASAGDAQPALEYELDFPEFSPDDKNSFLPRLWAGRKVNALLNEIRRTGREDPKLIDEIAYLAKRYGIVTPYTSFLMAEDVARAGQPELQERLKKRLRESAPAAANAPLEEKAARVQEAAALSSARRDYDRSGGVDAFYKQADDELRQQGKSSSSLEQIRYLGSRTFVRSAGQWVDTEFDAQQREPVQEVKLRSPEYFQLLDSDARLPQYMALGQATVKVGPRWYRFVE